MMSDTGSLCNIRFSNGFINFIKTSGEDKT